MKARDIIPGWPRGKSTSGPPIPLDMPREYYWFVITLHGDDMGRYIDDLGEDRRYHEGQQAMVDRFLQLGPMDPPLFSRHWVDLHFLR